MDLLEPLDRKALVKKLRNEFKKLKNNTKDLLIVLGVIMIPLIIALITYILKSIIRR